MPFTLFDIWIQCCYILKMREQLAWTLGQSTTISSLGKAVILQLMIRTQTGSVTICHSVTENSTELFPFTYISIISLLLSLFIALECYIKLYFRVQLCSNLLDYFRNTQYLAECFAQIRHSATNSWINEWVLLSFKKRERYCILPFFNFPPKEKILLSLV